MSVAKLAYLTSPAPNRFILHIQIGVCDYDFEISRAHLANIIIDGASMSLREQYQPRSQSTDNEMNANGRAATGS